MVDYMLGKIARGKGRPTAAFAVTLIGGIVILSGGIVTGILGLAVSSVFGFGSVPILVGAYASSVIGLVCGVIVIISSVMLDTKDKARITEWSTVGLIFSVLSLFDLGGFGVGFILGLIGSLLGLSKGE